MRITIVVLYPETGVLLLFYIIHSPVVIFLKSGFTVHALITVNCDIDYLVFNEVIILYFNEAMLAEGRMFAVSKLPTCVIRTGVHFCVIDSRRCGLLYGTYIIPGELHNRAPQDEDGCQWCSRSTTVSKQVSGAGAYSLYQQVLVEHDAKWKQLWREERGNKVHIRTQ